MIQIDEWVETIQEALNMREFRKALQLVEKALESYPDNDRLQKLRQIAKDRMDAEPFLKNFFNSGVSLYNSQLYNEALQQFEKIRSIDPTFPEVDEWIEKCRVELMSHAETAYINKESPQMQESMAASDPTQQKIRALIEEGQQLFQNRKYQEAIQKWSEIFMYDLTNEQAQQLIQKAQSKLREEQSQIEKRIHEAKIALKENDFVQAENLLREVLELDPHHEEANTLLQNIQKASRPEAEELETSIDDVVMEALKAHREERWNDAVRLWQQVLKNDPENIGAQTKYSEALRQLRIEGQITKLIEDARLFHMQGKRESAIHALSKAYRLRPDHPDVRNVMLEWQLTEQDLEEFSTTPPPVEKVEAKGFPKTILYILITLVVITLGGIIYWQFFHESPPPQPVIQKEPSEQGEPVKQTSQRAQRQQPPAQQNRPGQQTAQPPPAQLQPSQPQPKKELTKAEIRKRDALFKKARDLWQKRNLDAAYEAIKQAYEIDPTHPDVASLYQEVAQKYNEREQFIQGELSRAQDYTDSIDMESAVFVLMQAYKKYPEHPALQEAIKRAYYNLGLLLLRQGLCVQSRDIFDQIQLMFPREKRFRDLMPVVERCIRRKEITTETQRKLFDMKFLPLTGPLPQQ